MGGLFGRFLSFEEPVGPILTRLLYYFGLIAIIWGALRLIWFWIMRIDNVPMTALWQIMLVPFGAVIAIMGLRVAAELVLAIFRIDQSTYEQVTGKTAPPTERE
ncbi:MAG: DUF4282 domain-containing protein [Pseudomonadota bacterium]